MLQIYYSILCFSGKQIGQNRNEKSFWRKMKRVFYRQNNFDSLEYSKNVANDDKNDDNAKDGSGI